MSDYCINTPASLTVAYTATAGFMTGYLSPLTEGQSLFKLVMSTDAWVAQGIDATPIVSNSASADTLSAPGHRLITGMPIQVAALVDTAISKAWQVSAVGVFVDVTTAINEVTADDVMPFATGVLNDYLAIGYTTTFGQAKVIVSTSGTVGTAVWEYWNGSAWTALAGVTDNTTQLKVTPSTVTLTYTTPSDWAPRVLNASASLYYIRARALTTYTVNPLLEEAFIEGILPTGLSAATTYWAIAVDTVTFKLATTRALALAGTAIDLTTNGGGVTAATVAVAATAGSAYVPAKTMIDIDGSFGARISVVRATADGQASLYPVANVK